MTRLPTAKSCTHPALLPFPLNSKELPGAAPLYNRKKTIGHPHQWVQAGLQWSLATADFRGAPPLQIHLRRGKRWRYLSVDAGAGDTFVLRLFLYYVSPVRRQQHMRTTVVFLRLFFGNSVICERLTEEHGSELRVPLSCGAVQSASGSAPTPQKGRFRVAISARRGIPGCLRLAPEHEPASTSPTQSESPTPDRLSGYQVKQYKNNRRTTVVQQPINRARVTNAVLCSNQVLPSSR